ncbi:radical SAM protein [Candidatus Woesearchaeota archaeon]|nr:radical SAM protein [Candidatus Woesearchaeota archaeon]
MKVKEFFVRQTIKHGANKLFSLSDKNLIRFAKLTEKVAREKEAKIVRKLTEKWEQKHPYTLLVKRLFKELNKNCANKLTTNLIYNALIVGKKRGKELQKEYDMVIPQFLLFCPTMCCNLRCVGCSAGEYTQKDDLDFETMDRVIREAKELGMYFFTISGGEPYMWPHLLKIFEKHNDCYFQTYTNGTLITKGVAKKLAELGNVAPAISVEGYEKETDARRGKGIHNKALQAMENLKEAGVMFGFSATPTRCNSDLLCSDEFIDYYIGKGCYFGWFFQYIPIGLKPDVNLMATPKQRNKLRQKVNEWRNTKPVFLGDFWNDGCYVDGCLAGARSGGYLNINHKGDVEPCGFVHFAVDNIKNKSLKQVLKSDFFNAIRRRQPYDKDGNLLIPCMIIDNPQILRDVVKETGAYPTHPGADDVIKNPEVIKHLDKYSKEMKMIADKEWKEKFPYKVDEWKRKADEARSRGKDYIVKGT